MSVSEYGNHTTMPTIVGINRSCNDEHHKYREESKSLSGELQTTEHMRFSVGARWTHHRG